MTSISTKDRRYPAFMRLVSLGRAVKGRFMYEQDGTKVIEFLSASKVRRNPVASFGKDERKYQRAFSHYGEGFWRTAWWREAIQNAVDAKATRIDLSVERHDGFMLVSAADNGSGMSLDVLQNKFLSEGATSKGIHDSGGFGVAKELLLMPWMEWYVETNEYWAKGFREDPYEYDTLKTPRQGTLLRVKMPDKDGAHTDIEHAAAYIQRCYCPHIDFYCNGKKVLADLGKGKAVDKKVIGHEGVSVSHNMKSDIEGLFVRDSNNLFMFEKQLMDIKGAVVITLIGDTKQLLKDSRTDFGNYDLIKKFEKFMEKATVDVMSALKAPPEDIEVTLHEGKGRVRSIIQDVQSDLQFKIAKRFQERKVSKTDMDDLRDSVGKLAKNGSQEVNTTTSPDLIDVIMNMAVDKDAGEDVSEAAAVHLGHQPDVLVYNTCRDEVKLPSMLQPGPRMSPKMKKLLRFWTECCRIILIRLGAKVPFGVGWTIARDKDNERKYAKAYYACNLELSNGQIADGHWLLLNPYRKGLVPQEGEKHVFYSIRNDADLHYLFSVAMHECTHLFSGYNWHSEKFTSAHTDIVARNVPTSHLLKIIRNAVAKRMPGESEEEDDA